jgi:YfiR/HmsC-like
MLVVVACFLAGRAAAADNAALEYKVKAGYLFNFAKFVEWPESSFTNASAPFVVGLVGEDPFGGLLVETLAGRSVNGRNFVIRRFGPQEDLGQCHILFVSRSEKARAADILQSLRGHAVLTVGEHDRFGQLGGTINFSLLSGQVKLETNPEAATAAGLKISSKLLAASKTVKTEAPR